MKNRIIIEDDRTGEQRELELEIGVGQSVVDQVIAQGKVEYYEWNLLDVSPVGEDDPMLEPDRRFPRPQTLDFARMSNAVIEQDERAERGGVLSALQVDEASLRYMAQNRIDFMSQATDFSDRRALDVALMALYYDAFNLGIGFAQRGGRREG